MTALRTYYRNPNRCRECEKIIRVKDNERPSATKTRAFCSCSCSVSHNNRVFKRKPRKLCLMCPQSLTTRRTAFCSQKCRNASRRLKHGNRPMSHETIRADMIREHSAKCFKCGWDEINPVTGKCPIILNHIDGNSENMDAANLELLCPNCDSLTPTYKALNKGNGRHNHRLRYQAGKSY